MVLQQSWKRTIGLLAIIGMVVAGCAGSPSKTKEAPGAGQAPGDAKNQPAQQESGGTLVFGLSSEPPHMDPQLNAGNAQRMVKANLYRGLVAFNPDGSIAPDLAESYKLEGDRTYTFKLRSGVKFHNGDPLTTDDVIFSFSRIADPKVGAHLFKDLSLMQKIEAVDNSTVKITLKEPSASFLTKLAIPEAAVVSKKFTESVKGDLKNNVMGTGPFKVKSWKKGIELVVERFDGYFKQGLPKLDGIRFVPYADENLRVTALKAGDVDIVDYVPWKDMASIEADSNLKLDATPGPFMYIMFNLNKKPFDNPKVREAMAYAIDRQAIVDTVFFKRGSVLNGLILPQNSWAYDPSSANHYSYNPEKAKQLLAEAGFPNGFSATVLATSTYSFHQQTAEVVQAYLTKVGINVTLDLPDWPTRVQRGAQGDYQMMVNGVSPDFTDPDMYSIFWHSGPVNVYTSPHFADAKLDQLLDAANRETEQAKRKDLYLQAQKRALEVTPLVFLAGRNQSHAFKKSVQGFDTYPGFLVFYSGLTLEKTTIKR